MSNHNFALFMAHAASRQMLRRDNRLGEHIVHNQPVATAIPYSLAMPPWGRQSRLEYSTVRIISPLQLRFHTLLQCHLEDVKVA